MKGMFVCTLVCLVFLTGCMQSVKPWERGFLAKPQMQLDTDPERSKIMKHTFSSKEAATGGYGVGGGGCGCN